MASGKETPRQKMVGLMYLVLMALLAMNVSKDILLSFVVLNDGLEQASEIYDLKNLALSADFKLANSVNPKKVGPYWIQAQKAQAMSAEIDLYISDLKKEVMAVGDGLSPEVADTINLKYIEKKDVYDGPMSILLGDAEDGSGGKASELKDLVINYRAKLLEMLPEEQRKNAKINLNMGDMYNADHELENWETGNFYHTPLTADITILTELQNQVKDAEFYVVNELYKAVSDDQIPFDTVAAKVFAQSSYVVLGEEYQSDIFLAGFSKTQNPEIYIGTLDAVSRQLTTVTDTLEVVNGKAIFKVPTTQEGTKSYEGAIAMTLPSGEKMTYPFKSEYIVARPNVVISPIKMNVFYKGIENPVSISVPGIPDSKIRPSINGGNRLVKKNDGTYDVVVSQNSPIKTDITVSAEMANGEMKNMGTLSFRVKNLPKPYAKIKDITTTGKMDQNTLASMQGIRAEFDKTFVYSFPIKVKSYTMEVASDARVPPIDIVGNTFKPEIVNVIKRLPKKSKVVFRNIKAKTPDGVVHDLSPIMITIF